MKPENARSGFEQSGTYPFNPSKIQESALDIARPLTQPRPAHEDVSSNSEKTPTSVEKASTSAGLESPVSMQYLSFLA